LKAVVCYGDNILNFEEKPKPVPLDREVLIKVSAAGICGSDHGVFSGNGPSWVQYPVIPGHECSGVVEEIGERVTGFVKGEGVVVDNYLFCGKCKYCKTGRYFLCEEHAEIGMTIDGGFAEYCVVPDTNLVKLPEFLSSVESVLVEPLATALRACHDSRMCAGDNIVVIGCGPLGALIAQVSCLMGASVYLVGRGKRLEWIRNNLSVFAVDSTRTGWVDILRKEIGGGAEVIFEVSGSSDMIHTGTSLLKKTGRFILMGITSGKSGRIPVDAIVLEEKEVIGRVSGMGMFEEAVRLIASEKIAPNSFITHRFSFSDYRKAIETETKRIEGAMKVILVP